MGLVRESGLNAAQPAGNDTRTDENCFIGSDNCCGVCWLLHSIFTAHQGRGRVELLALLLCLRHGYRPTGDAAGLLRYRRHIRVGAPQDAKHFLISPHFNLFGWIHQHRASIRPER